MGRRLGLILAAAGFSAALLAQPAKLVLAAEHNWKMQAEWGGGPLMELGAKAFAERIKLLTDGRIEVQVLPVGTLAKGLESRTAVVVTDRYQIPPPNPNGPVDCPT